MSIIITGLEMPTERENFNLTIKYNGTVLDTETGMQVAEAYELSPHGRLGDLDMLYSEMETYSDYYGAKEYHDDEMIHRDSILYAIEQAPTIIPAEGNNNDSF